MTAKVLNLKKKSVIDEKIPPNILQQESEDESRRHLPPELQEAIEVLGLNHPTFKHSEDYDWMLDTTREILKRYGIEYFRRDVVNLMSSWADYC